MKKFITRTMSENVLKMKLILIKYILYVYGVVTVIKFYEKF